PARLRGESRGSACRRRRGAGGQWTCGGVRGQLITTEITWYPEEPSGAGGALTPVCGPVGSQARQRTACRPGLAWSQVKDHCRQVSTPGVAARSASCQGPSSTCTCTRCTPRCCAQAVPPRATAPAASSDPDRGTSIRLAVLIGPRASQPRSVQ